LINPPITATTREDEGAKQHLPTRQAGILRTGNQRCLGHEVFFFAAGQRMPVLDDLLFGHQPFGPEHQADTEEQQRRAEQAAQHRRVEAEVLRRTRQVPMPWQCAEGHDEGDAGEPGDREARDHTALGALLRLGSGDREAVPAMDDVDALVLGPRHHPLFDAHVAELVERR
jgi:hypothetical protein